MFHIPTKIFTGEPKDFSGEFACPGARRAFIVTGKSSAANGSLLDVKGLLEANGTEVFVFDATEENPSVENVAAAARLAAEARAELFVGIGGGSPLDAVKAVMLLAANAEKNFCDADAVRMLYDPAPLCKRLPVWAVPTTAGTGSETTPFAILTLHGKQTKQSMPHLVCMEKAFLCERYTASMPRRIASGTAADALAHLAEGYLSSRAGPLTDAMAEGGIASFSQSMDALANNALDAEHRSRLLSVSALAGMVITHTKTSLPHQMSYALTYNKKIPHGEACGLLLAEFMRFHANKKRTGRILNLLGLSDLDELKKYLRGILHTRLDLSREETAAYSAAAAANPERLRAHPYPVTEKDIAGIYERSMS
ncbi:MAG: iron-containing alcohol dehydrogenase [Defluviitaleaceae bacterium]|nr:iron-containing alcohol dehydrogenase [Defluviitaleaceae bacterium]